MNGGQIDNGDDGLIIIGGWMEILANTPIYVTTDATADRSYQIDARLTGGGSIDYHSAVGDLNITGASNTYSGTWNVVQGALLGSGPGFAWDQQPRDWRLGFSRGAGDALRHQ